MMPWSWIWFAAVLVLVVVIYAQGLTLDMLAADVATCLGAR